MDAFLAKPPEEASNASIASWKRLGVLTDEKMRDLSTKHGADEIEIDDTVEVKRWEEYGKIFYGFVKKGSNNKEHGTIRIIKPGQWFEERQEKMGKKHGYARLVWYDGRYEVEHFKDGIRHGPEHGYKKDGTLKYVKHYHEGEMVHQE